MEEMEIKQNAKSKPTKMVSFVMYLSLKISCRTELKAGAAGRATKPVDTFLRRGTIR
jgi:hypothetical protein